MGNLGEGLYAGGLCVEEGSRMGLSPHRCPVWGPGEWGPSTVNFERWMKGAVGMGHLSEEAHCGSILCCVHWAMKGSLWGRASLFMGAQLGNLEWARLPETLRDD